MKTRVNSEISKNINLIDIACQSATKIVEELSINSPVKDRMWNSLSKRLNSINKKILSWFLISTTSVSVILASTVIINSYYDKGNMDIVEQDAISYSTPINSSDLLKLDTKSSFQPIISILSHKSDYIIPPPISQIKDVKIPTRKNNILNVINKTSHENYPIHPLEISVAMNGYSSPITLIPEIGLDYEIFHKTKENRTFWVYFGLSALLNKSNSHYASKEYNKEASIASNQYFSNLTLKIQDDSKGSTWTGKVGYLLNKNKNSKFKKNTVRVSLQRNLNKYVRLGPELFITNDFQKYYPGFGITVET